MDTCTFKTLGKGPNQQLQCFARLLQAENRKYNLTRITETGQIYLRHFADALQLAGLLDRLHCSASSGASRLRLIDLGSGAGLPGLALALARPAWDVVSVEATGKKTRFQEQVKASTGSTNVQIIQARVEHLGQNPAYRSRFDLVTARAVAHLRILAELGLPLARLGGTLAFYKGPHVEQELREARPTVDHLGGRIVDTVTYRLSDIAQDLDPIPEAPDAKLSLVIMEKASATPPAFPRSYALIKRQALPTPNYS